MRICRLFWTLLAIIVIACLFGVQGQFQGQYVPPSSGYSTAAPSAAQNTAQFSQFYTMTTGPAPSNPISAPQRFEIAGMPSAVYLGEQMQSMPYSQYRSSPAYTANSLWIKGATTWTQYAVVPQGATVSLFAISPNGGSGSLTSDGQTYSNNYVFYLNSLLTFYVGTIGRHTLSFAINGQSSNQVVIDVVGGTYTQPSNNPGYYPENNPGYNQENYPWDYYPWDNYPSCPADQQQCDEQCCPAGQICVNGNCETPSPPLEPPVVSAAPLPPPEPPVVNAPPLPPLEPPVVNAPPSPPLEPPVVSAAPSPPPEPPIVTTPGTQPSENGGASENPGGDNEVQCEAGYHLENGNCVPDQVDTVQDNTGRDTRGNHKSGNNLDK